MGENMNKKTNKKGIVLAAALLVLLCIMAIFVYYNFMPKGTVGEKKIQVVVIHGDQSEKRFHYQTEAAYLGEVLKENDLLEGEQGQYGLFITSVDGERADDRRQQWWCITKQGAQVNTSADQTPIENGDQFELTLKEGY